jgi:hypothetical protein
MTLLITVAETRRVLRRTASSGPRNAPAPAGSTSTRNWTALRILAAEQAIDGHRPCATFTMRQHLGR